MQNTEWNIPLCPFPSVLWWKLQRADCNIDIGRNYVKQTMRNRYIILSAQGPLTLTIPVRSQNGQPMPYQSIELETGSWPSKHWRSIAAAYGKSAYFEHYEHKLRPLFEQQFHSLLAFNTAALEVLCGLIKLDKPSMQKEIRGEDLSPMFEPSFATPPFPKHVQVFMDRLP
ncbi:MAG: WbqC family protein, partial [Flavobacteriales bacterium]